MNARSTFASLTFMVVACTTADPGLVSDPGMAAMPCPSGAGPAMIRAGGASCIDVTEVSRAQYAEFLAGAPDLLAQTAECAWNTDFTPTCSWPPGSQGALPVGCVDWCDARAFCEAAGKRLCGAIGGGPVPLADFADPERDEWYRACSSGGKYAYTYGDEHQPDACQSGDEDKWATVAVGSLPRCQSPDDGYAGIFDLTGNAMEWVDACTGASNQNDECRARGGSYYNLGTSLMCAAGASLTLPRIARANGVSFRCCAD